MKISVRQEMEGRRKFCSREWKEGDVSRKNIRQERRTRGKWERKSFTAGDGNRENRKRRT